MADDKPTMHITEMNMENIAVCTTVSKNYLAFARVLSKSLREQHPSLKIFVLLVDHLEGAFDPDKEPFELIEIEELDNIPEPKNFFFKYKPIELNTASKPYLFEYLFRKYNLSKLIYLDPDILVLDSLQPVWNLLDHNNIVLTPHITKPYTDDRNPDEKHILQSGIFNLGFIAMANTSETHDFLRWWQKRLYDFCFMDISQGMHVDQNWVNFAPVMFEGVHILKDPAFNIAYWNLHSRADAITLEEGKWKIHGKPVVFFHFSGFDTDNIEQVSKHQNRFRLGNLPNLRPLFESYRDRLLADGHRDCSRWRYAYGFFDNDVAVSDFIRKLYNAITKSGQYFSNPFSTSHAQSFFNWLNQSIDTEEMSVEISITRLMAYIYSNRIDIKFAFRRPQGVDRAAFVQWFKTFAKREHQLDDAFIPGTERFKDFTSRMSSISTALPEQKSGRELPLGINYAGYFKGEFGVAVAARNYIYALQTTQIPYVLNNVIAGEHRHHDRSFQEFSDDNPYYVNIIHVNADQAKVFRNMKGPQYYKDRYNIGFWVWELEKFPEKRLSSFQYYQEIWVPSEFCKQSIVRVSPVPVTKIKHPIILDENAIRADRKRFSLPEDEFVFLFVFDYLSVVERKNPLGMIRAFQKAFRKDDRVSLIIKSINSNQAPEKAAYIQTITDGYNIRFIDRHLDPEDMLSLMASVDCFVSLHRSEGFGLGMAQSMYLGKPVIATGYSGNMDFMKPSNSFLVDYKLIELEKDFEPYEKGNVWAEPDIDHAAELMRVVYDDRALAAKKAQQAAWDIRMELSPQAIGAEMQARIKQIYEGQEPSLQRPADISVQKPVEVSIIIPVFNKLELTRQCLDTIRQTSGNIPYEIIVVDNGSSDGTTEYLRQEEAASRLRALLNNENLGFATACNQGAKEAKGRYILFLNNDTIPQPHWLEEMVRTAESDPNIGIVGSKLLYPDGTIQHAGVVVWKNKRPYHIYKNCAGDLPGANIRRDYQIVTAACMLVRKETFFDVEGFDDRYFNGLEDVDLCLKVGQKNKRVVYNPKSVVIHLESQTEGRQDYMDVNRVLYEQRWRDKIKQDDLFYLRQDGMEAMVDLDGSFYFVSTKELKQINMSIVIVTFNSASTIRACLDSVLADTEKPFEVIVVDNASQDETKTILEDEYKDRVALILNNENKGFSFACNQGIRASKGEYVILLNPDTVVTPMWKERLLAHFSPGVGAVGPLSNYTNEMQLSKYYARDANWDRITSFHERAVKLYEWNRGLGRETKLLMGFCLALPRKVLNEVGLLDEDLFLGSEDLEISWRLRQRGYKLIIATDTFIYHEGQVSFKSVKQRPSTRESDRKLYEKLVAHYGEGNVPHPMELWGVDFFNPEGARFLPPSLSERKYDSYKISPNPSLPKRGTFAAVYCVYDDTTWLSESIESVYHAVEAIYFLVSDRPWQGQTGDSSGTLDLIGRFPDPQKKITVTRRNWTNETDQRNAGLDMLKEKGIAYCFVIDADEVYDPAELKKMMKLVISRPDVDCWHIALDTYWKSYRYRIEPREPLTPPVFVKTDGVRFTQNRLAIGKNHMLIPPETGICHHLSYARSDEEVLKKITTFSHAHEIQPGWFENVWKKWDTDHSLTNLHPTHPHSYQRAVEQPYSALPPVLKRRYLPDEKIGGGMIPGLTSIIIPVYNQWEHTSLCLESIGRHTPEPHEVIVVDNGSTDETKTNLRSLMKTNPRLKVISNTANRGFAAGNNQGISIARGEYILLLNNDTIVTGGWLGRMTEVFKRYPKTGIVGPMSNSVTRPQVIEKVGYENIHGIDDFARGWTKEHEGQSFPTVKASGFCLLAGRKVIDTIGGLDEQFGTGNFEDDDFCSRAFLSGFEIRIAQDVFIHHTGRQTFRSAGIDYGANMARNWELYKSKWGIPKNTPLENYWIPSRIPEGMSLFVPLPDVSSDHTVDHENRWWEEIRQKEEVKVQVQQGEVQAEARGKAQAKVQAQAEVQERIKSLTSIILLLSGRREYAKKCVESIQKHTGEPYEMIFIPRDPSYAPPKWLRKLIKGNKKYRLVKNTLLTSFDTLRMTKVMASRSNHPPLSKGGQEGISSKNDRILSFAQASNLGINESSGEYILLLDDAAEVTEEWLTGMLECLNSDPDTGIVGPMTVNVEGRQAVGNSTSLRSASGGEAISGQKTGSPRSARDDSKTKEIHGDSLRLVEHGDLPGPMETDEFAKAFRERNRYRRVYVKDVDSFCMLFRRQLTERIGLFDEQFETDEFAGDDYCVRAAVEDHTNLIAGDVFIHFHGHRRHEKKRADSPSPVIADKRLFGEKWGNPEEAGPESKKLNGINALFLSDELHQKGQREKAVVTLVEGIKLYPEKKSLRYVLAEILIEDKKYNEAFELLEQMPDGFTKDARKLELMGSCKIYMGLSEEAGRYADEILLLNNASSKAWNLKGTVAFEKGLYVEAERSFQKAVESDRSFGEAYANIGALRWASGNKEEALKLFERAFILSPTVEDIVTNYYTAVVSLSRLPEAERNFEEAILLHPFNRRLKFILVDNLLQQGKYHEAMEAMEEAMAVFGINDDTLTVALKLRDRIGAMEIGKAQGPGSLRPGESARVRKGAILRQDFGVSAQSNAQDDKHHHGEIVEGNVTLSPSKGHGEPVEPSSPDLSRRMTPPNPPLIKGGHGGVSLRSPDLNVSQRASISLCMIVKNEEQNIVRALRSMKPVVDEMIIVDTGSTDSTKKIARAFGAKVYDFQWSDDFSAARNFSLSKASGDWILVLDADEVISPDDYDKLKELVKTVETRGDSSRLMETKKSPDLNVSQGVSNLIAYSFISRNYVGPVSVNWNPNDGAYKEEAGSGWFPSEKVRMFPNDSRIRFDKPVHETVEDSLSRIGTKIKKIDIPIHHYGKLSMKQVHAKGDQYYELGKKKLSEQGEQDPHALYELAMQASELEKNEEALEYWKKLIALKPGFAKAYHGLGTCYYRLSRYDDALSAFKKAVQLEPDAKDSVLMYATCALYAGNTETAIYQLENILRKEPDYSVAMHAVTAAYLCSGRKDKGLEYFRKAQDTQFSIVPYLSAMAELLISLKRFDYACRLLEALEETGNAAKDTSRLLEECNEKKRAETHRDSSRLMTPPNPPLTKGGPGGVSLQSPVSKSLNESQRVSSSESPDLNVSQGVSISLCMIVKNEEGNIEKALMSVKPVVGEMVVVDTGSADRTREIAERLGARVYDFPWTDSFSDARNFSLSKASSDWILILDADEAISPLDYGKLRELVKEKGSRGGHTKTHSDPRTLESSNPAVIAYSFVTRNYVVQANTAGWIANDGTYSGEEAGTGWFHGEKVRLFPNDSRIRFENPVHERIEPSLLKLGIEVKRSEISVHHYGLLDENKMSAKHEYYYNLGKARLAEKGIDDVKALYDLAVQASGIGRYEEALEHLRKVIALRPDFSKAYQSMGNACYNLGRYGDALPYYKKAMEMNPGSRDAVLMYATCRIFSGNAEESVALLEELVRNDSAYPQAFLLLSEAYFCTGRREQGLEYVRKLLDMNIDCGTYFTGFAKILISVKRTDYALSLLNAAVETDTANNETRQLLEECRRLKST